jgi:hypothetical protein
MNEEEKNYGVVTEVVAAHSVEQATKDRRRKFLLGAGIVAICLMLVVIVDSWLSREDTGFKSVPPSLIGTWTSSHPEYSDRSLVLKSDSITFGTGATSTMRYTIIGVAPQEDDDDKYFVVHFRGDDGAKFRREIVLSNDGESLHFRSQPHVIWKKFKL